MTKEQQLEIKIWKAAKRWAGLAWKCKWINKSQWYEEAEIASSIYGFVCKELKIDYWNPKNKIKNKKYGK